MQKRCRMFTTRTTNVEKLSNGHKTDYKCRKDVEWSQNGQQMQKGCRMISKRTTNVEMMQNGHKIYYNRRNDVEWSKMDNK